MQRANPASVPALETTGEGAGPAIPRIELRVGVGDESGRQITRDGPGCHVEESNFDDLPFTGLIPEPERSQDRGEKRQ
jgi:hypothetical protein